MHPIMLADYSKKISALPPNVNSLADLAARELERSEGKAKRVIDKRKFDN